MNKRLATDNICQVAAKRAKKASSSIQSSISLIVKLRVSKKVSPPIHSPPSLLVRLKVPTLTSVPGIRDGLHDQFIPNATVVPLIRTIENVSPTGLVDTIAGANEDSQPKIPTALSILGPSYGSPPAWADVRIITSLMSSTC